MTKDIIKETGEMMKFCVYCRTSPNFCKCNNKIKFAVWIEPFEETLKQALAKERKKWEEDTKDYFDEEDRAVINYFFKNIGLEDKNGN